jgi:hypothetical protein
VARWIDDQKAIPSTHVRAYYRQRANPFHQPDCDNPYVSCTGAESRVRKACEVGSRWDRFSFYYADWNKALEVSKDQSTNTVVLSIDGVVRTELNGCDWNAYLERYADLKAAFGDDVGAAAVHYQTTGASDGRNCTGLHSHRDRADWPEKAEPGSASNYTLCRQAEKGNPFDIHTGQFVPGNWIWVAFSTDGSSPNCNDKATRIVLKHPPIHFRTPDPGNTVVFGDADVEIVKLNVMGASSFDMDARDAAAVITSWSVPCAADMMYKQNGLLFMGYKGEFYRYEQRMKMSDNTVDAPAASSSDSEVSTCPSAVKSFLNHGKCVRKGNCAQPTFSSALVPLTEANLRLMYNVSQRHVHFVTGLRLENHNVFSPCRPESGKSRWRFLDGACPHPTPLDNSTLVSLVTALSGSSDANEMIRDINAPAGACFTELDGVSVIGAQIEVGGSCFEHVHPDLYSVRDFNYWAKMHFGGQTNIEKWAEAGSAELSFPATHPMARWEQYKGRLSYLGRLGDLVSFSALPTEVQTVEIARHFGAQEGRESDSVVACGSPEEVANRPELGHHYHFTESTKTPRLDFPHQDRYARSMVVLNVNFKAPDQLRQRTAWALSQIFTIAMPGTQRQGLTECWLTYYDVSEVPHLLFI